MSTAVWPPIDPRQLAEEQTASQARELEWLIGELRESLQSLKAGLEECAALLAPSEHGSTLVLSSMRSESLKGVVTRVGTRIVKGNIKLRLPSLPPPRGASSYDLSISTAPTAPDLVIHQLSSVKNAINHSLDVIDVTTWAGDSKNADYIAGQMQLLADNVREARQALKGYSDVQMPWWKDPIDDKTFDPPLPPNVSFHLSIFDAALLLEIRTLEILEPGETHSGFSFRNTLAVAWGGARHPPHDEADRTFTYKGREVRVKEKIRIESQDPALMAVMAKFGAVSHSISLSLKALNIVMGRDESSEPLIC
ncbi:uncharacterized protein EI97DRAFT_150408 [Westerdykella ornata]|uniref:RAVE subunit 2/Rogdi n=1 Tax=Westerdykella ornata TaxID=318751 RepID=A0A6A6JAS0_WESOR|nr:uncharacterized protein EI97DRAFT_150408 [Westerdykella ornata]KAF2273700.1 hypothetical protein EI97DRAFT_150408 [Westerdykella ornata]